MCGCVSNVANRRDVARRERGRAFGHAAFLALNLAMRAFEQAKADRFVPAAVVLSIIATLLLIFFGRW